MLAVSACALAAAVATAAAPGGPYRQPPPLAAAAPVGHHALWGIVHGFHPVPQQPHLRPEVQPWYAYGSGFAAPAFQWGYFGAGRRHAFTTKHNGYHGRKNQLTIRWED